MGARLVSFTIGELKKEAKKMQCPYCGAQLIVEWDSDLDGPIVSGDCCEHFDPEYEYTTHDLQGFELPEDQIKVNFYFEN